MSRLKKVSENIRDAEFKNLLADLSLELAEAKMKMAVLIGENADLHNTIRELKSVEGTPCPKCRKRGWHIEKSEPDEIFGAAGGRSKNIPMTSYSPLLEHVGLDLWKPRGVQIDPVTIEAVRQENQLRPREIRLLEYGWNTDGKLWIAWRLPSSKAGLVLSVPGCIRRYLSNRPFTVIANDSSRCFINYS